MATAMTTVISMITTLPVFAVSEVATGNIQQAFVGLDQVGGLFGELQCHHLQTIGFYLAENNRLGGLIPTGK